MAHKYTTHWGLRKSKPYSSDSQPHCTLGPSGQPPSPNRCQGPLIDLAAGICPTTTPPWACNALSCGGLTGRAARKHQVGLLHKVLGDLGSTDRDRAVDSLYAGL